MRKLLLATVAGLGAWGASETGAMAQALAPAPYYAPITSGTMGGAALPAAPSPVPGTIVVRLNGRVRFYAFAANDGDANNNAANTGAASTVTGQGTATGGYKLANYGFAEYGRLYPGFDGIAANGLKYGANLEIRQDQNSGAGGGAFGSVSQQDRARAALYFRRVWGYLGTNELGTIRMGSTDQPTSLYLTGNFENFDDGGLNGDLPGFQPGSLQFPWPFQDGGSYYTTNKVVYLSPQFFGFDMGVSFEPSTANVSSSINCASAGGSPVGTNFVNSAGTFTAASGAQTNGAAPGCDTLASSPSNAESARRKNSVDVLLRYRGSFGPVGIAATAAYMGGSHVTDNQTGVPFNNNSLAGPVRYNYQGLSVGDFGAALTIGGLSFGGHYSVGRFNEAVYNLEPAGFTHSEASLVGASYTIGPVIFGAHAALITSPGDLQNAAQGRIRREWGVAAGATYSIAPGVGLWLSGLYSDRKQNGYNFITGQGVSAATPGGNAFNNKVTSSVIALGTAFSW